MVDGQGCVVPDVGGVLHMVVGDVARRGVSEQKETTDVETNKQNIAKSRA